MKRMTILFVLGALLAVSGAGCIFSPTTTEPPPPRTQYVEPTSPENQMENLQVAYRRYLSDGIDEYAKILAPEFRFYFQDGDEPNGLGRNYWLRDEDSTGTAALFRSPEVTNIQIDLNYGKATVPNEVDMPDGALKVRVSPTNLTVDDRSGITYEVTGDIQDMFFRKGLVENAGEDTTAWYLFEWRDIPAGGGNSAAPDGGLTLAGRDAPVDGGARTVTWGALMQRFGPAVPVN